MVQSRLHKSENLPLCHEDHVEMHVPQAGTWTEVPRYVCPKGGCSVSYNFRQGYSMLIRRRQYTRRNMPPRIRCPRGTTDVPFWGYTREEKFSAMEMPAVRRELSVSRVVTG